MIRFKLESDSVWVLSAWLGMCLGHDEFRKVFSSESDKVFFSTG